MPETRERGIPFSAAMAKAVWRGRKTMTRRLVKPQPIIGVDDALKFPWASFWDNGTVHTWDREGIGGQNWNANDHPDEDKFEQALLRTPYRDACPYGVVGDRLWVREPWRVGACADGCSPAELAPHYWTPGGPNGGMWYDATDSQPTTPISPKGRYRHARFMPRWASRMLLEITTITVEPVLSITEDDAIAEGFVAEKPGPAIREDARDAFLRTFFDLNQRAPRGTNPWVWVIGFKRLLERSA